MLPNQPELSAKARDFLKLFPNTLYTYIPDSNGNLPVIHSEILDLARQEQGYGVFFSVNGFQGGKRDTASLTNINAFYCDIDYPDKVNRTPETIRQFKNELVMELVDSEVVPTAMIETKNGLHVYWVLEQPIFLNQLNEEQVARLLPLYRQIEEAILHKLDGDPMAKDLTRVLRVPDTLHLKDPNDPFKIQVQFYNLEMKYKFSEIKEKFLKKDAPDAWAEVNQEAGLSPEIKTQVEKLYPRLDRPSYQKLLNKKEGVTEGNRNRALLIVAHACKEAGWSLQQTYDYFDEYQGLSIHEIRKTIRSAFEHNYEFGYNNEVMQAIVPAEERQKLSEVTGKALKKTTQESNALTNKFQKDLFLTYEHIIAERYPHMKYKYRGDFYFYEGGVYKPLQVEEVRNIFLREMLSDGLTLYRKVTAVNDKIACFKSLDGKTFHHDDENPDPNILNFKNGLLNIETYKLVEHTPNYLSTAQIPIDYDAQARAPRWFQFINEVTDGDEHQATLLQQIAGYCLTNDVSFAKAFIFYGSGANGKSLFTRMISKLIGKENVSNLNLTTITKQFGLTGLVGRRLNIIDEISGNYFESNIIKNLVSGERMMVDIKFRPEPLEFTPIAKLIFSVNELPKINDTTPGLYRRFIIVPFLRTFINNPELDLEAKLTAELPGILNWAVEGLKKLRAEGRFHETEKNFEIMRAFKSENSPLLEFLDANYEPGDPLRHAVPAQELYQKYRTYCLESGYKPKAMSNFIKELFHATYEGWSLQRGKEGTKVLVQGIRPTVGLHGEILQYQPGEGF